MVISQILSYGIKYIFVSQEKALMGKISRISYSFRNGYHCLVELGVKDLVGNVSGFNSNTRIFIKIHFYLTQSNLLPIS